MLTGRRVLAIAVTAFGVIFAVNMTMAFLAVGTFPGLEVKNSYVASQSFDADRDAQLALGWQARLAHRDGQLELYLDGPDGRPAPAEIVQAVLGRPTHVRDDLSPEFRFDGDAWRAPVALADGNWNLRLEARAPDGTMFRQRIVMHLIN